MALRPVKHPAVLSPSVQQQSDPVVQRSNNKVAQLLFPKSQILYPIPL